MDKEWYRSKTKVGALIAGVGAILTSIGLMYAGKLDLVTGLTSLVAEIGGILAIFGLRNALQ